MTPEEATAHKAISPAFFDYSSALPEALEVARRVTLAQLEVARSIVLGTFADGTKVPSEMLPSVMYAMNCNSHVELVLMERRDYLNRREAGEPHA